MTGIETALVALGAAALGLCAIGWNRGPTLGTRVRTTMGPSGPERAKGGGKAGDAE